MFKNIYDIGYHGSIQKTPANVYAFLNPKGQLKSADPVTYNAFGRVIPLSKRFGAKNEFRYSLKETNSSKNLEIKTKGEYNRNINGSLYADGVMFSSRYESLDRATRNLYDLAKSGDFKSAYKLVSHLLKEDTEDKIRSLGNDVYLYWP
ncbi:MAG: hypothetical protein IKA95_03330 [Clostridia bacterium]|nr:hypothetical protein [Clostridia bacterium]